MDGIQAYSAAPHPHPTQPHPPQRPIVATVHAPGGHGPGGGAAIKTASDYIGAVRRRIWLALLVAIPLASAGTLLVLRLPAIYAVTALISIDPPKTDPAIRSLVGSGEMIISDSGTSETYIPSTLALLNSRSFLQEILFSKELGLPPAALDSADPALEMSLKLKPRIIPRSNNVVITYEGKDPELITRILNHTLKKFEERADYRSRLPINDARDKAWETLKAYGKELDGINKNLERLVRESKDIAPNGRSLKEAEVAMLQGRLMHMEGQVDSTKQKLQLDALAPQAVAPAAVARAEKIARLQEKRAVPADKLRKAINATRDTNDAAVRHAREQVRDIDAQLAQLERPIAGPDTSTREEAAQAILAREVENIDETRARIAELNEDIRGSVSVYQEFETLKADREMKARQVAQTRERLSAFNIVSNAQKRPVEIIDMADTPVIPVRPNRILYIAACLVLALGAGVGLVCLLEHVDHSVKVPEHLTAGLALPLFGVVPRMIRGAKNHRGGHLWTSGTPDSIEADAYRNLRASLLGALDGKGTIVTLLITSAKAGEGKSTTALNLAATCARAGERTLLMDVDLRRPSLNGVFPAQDHDHGLVDVLRGDLPWQRVIVQTDLPNLDFLPTGNTADVPIEVLGSLELRQLLLSLSQNHYDRVILDGPAVLGLADCRMLGRIVDAAVMVVRSGSQEIRSLQRAKAMLEQSQVFIAGLVFNGLRDDLENWSSYGPNPFLEAPISLAAGRRPAAALVGTEV